MSLALAPLGLTALAIRVAGRVGTNGWLAVVAEAGQSGALAEALVDELAGLGECEVAPVQAETPEKLPHDLRQYAASVMVVFGLDGWTEDDWRSLDADRNALPEDRVVLLVLSGAAWSHLVNTAPHLASWVGGAWSVDPQAHLLGSAQRAQRLAELRAHFGWTDEELLLRAEAQTLPAEPDLAEWLVLLGRGDLVCTR